MNKIMKINLSFILLLLLSLSFNFVCAVKTLEFEANSVTSGNANSKQIQGKMQIDGKSYTALCDCSPVTPESRDTSQGDGKGPFCDPSKLKIRGEKGGIGASYDDVRNLVGNIEELNYVKVPEASFSCLDGRFNDPILGTPGGDAGEFILALSVYEDLLGGGRKLTQNSVDHFFSQYLKLMKPRKFLMCTDDFAVNHIEKELNVKKK
jgi:hypothetical protein